MRCSFRIRPDSIRHACDILEHLCEGYVNAMICEMAAHPDKDHYPCCINCGGFGVQESYQVPLPERSFDDDADRIASMTKLPHGGISVRVNSAAKILSSGCGNTVELACYQCAQRRMSGDDVGAKVTILPVGGGFRAAVINSGQHRKDDRKNALDDPMSHVKAGAECGCIADE